MKAAVASMGNVVRHHAAQHDVLRHGRRKGLGISEAILQAEEHGAGLRDCRKAAGDVGSRCRFCGDQDQVGVGCSAQIGTEPDGRCGYPPMLAVKV